MNLEWSILIGIISVVFSAGAAWGVVKASLNSNKERIKSLEDKMEALGNCDDVVRKYLFANDGMTVYVPAAFCGKQHEKQEEQFNKLTEKMDKIIDILMEKHNK